MINKHIQQIIIYGIHYQSLPSPQQ